MTSIKVTNIPVQPLFLGFPGENDSRPVSVDVSPWLEEFPDGTVTIVYTRSDGLTYAVVVNQPGPVVTWKPQRRDLVKGDCSLQIQIKQGDAVKKDRIVDCLVGNSIDDPSDPPEEPRPTYVEETIAAADRADAAAAAAEGAAERAEEAGGDVSPEAIAEAVEDYFDEHPIDVPTDAVLYTPQSLSDAQKEQARLNIDAVSERTYDTLEMDVENVKAAAYAHIRDASAHVSAADRERWNDGGGSAANAVLYTQQSLTPAQQEQARGNIGAGTYTKPSGGIPDSDIASAATWNAKYTKPASGIPKSDLAAGVIPTVPQMATQTDMTDWTSGKTVDAAVLKNGVQYIERTIEGKADASDIPTVPQMATQANMSDWTSGKTVDASAVKTVVSAARTVVLENSDAISNLQTDKADKTDIPTAVSELANDSGYQTASDVHTAIAAIPAELPAVTASDNGKFLRVVNGAWAAETVSTWQGGSY